MDQVERYRKTCEAVLASLTAGGKKLTDVATPEHWECHSWTNCPMHAAFGADGLHQVPDEHRQAAATFIALFDGKHIPMPVIAEEPKS